MKEEMSKAQPLEKNRDDDGMLEPLGKSGLKKGTAGAICRVKTMRTEPPGRYVRLITDVTGTAGQ
jgi:hypothetical protein